MFGNFSLFKTPFLGWSSVSTSFVFLSFIFFLPPFEDNGLLFWVPDVLCQHSEVVLWNLLCLNVLLMNLWERKWSPHPIPLPSSRLSPHLFYKCNFYSILKIFDCNPDSVPVKLGVPCSWVKDNEIRCLGCLLQ